MVSPEQDKPAQSSPLQGSHNNQHSGLAASREDAARIFDEISQKAQAKVSDAASIGTQAQVVIKKEKKNSTIIYVGLAVFVLVALFLLTWGPMQCVRSTTGDRPIVGIDDIDTDHGQETTDTPIEFSDPTAGVSLTIPAGWQQAEISQQHADNGMFLSLDNKSESAVIFVYTFNMSRENYERLAAEGISDITSSTFRSTFDEVSDVAEQTVMIGNSQYIETTANAKDEGKPYIYFARSMVTYQNDRLYDFVFFDYRNAASFADDVQSYDDLLTSVVYE